jgi:hypothetical protein
MAIAVIIQYISMFFWFLPPIRQYKERFFIYFLIWALSDPLNLVALHIFQISNYYIHPIASVLLIYSIDFSSNDIKKYWYFHILFIAAFIAGLFLIPNRLHLIIILHIIIIFKFLKIAFVSFYKYNAINVFLFVLVFYEILMVINLLVFLNNYDIKVIFYYSTVLFESIIAMFFSIFKEDNPRLKIKLKSSPQSSSH